MAAHARHDLVIARRQQLAADRTLAAVGIELDLMLGIPAGIVADDRDERQSLCAPPYRTRPCGSRRSRRRASRSPWRSGRASLAASANGNRGSDRSGRPVDERQRRIDARLRPLAELAAVDDQTTFGCGIERALTARADFGRMQRRLRAPLRALPRLGDDTGTAACDLLRPARSRCPALGARATSRSAALAEDRQAR